MYVSRAEAELLQGQLSTAELNLLEANVTVSVQMLQEEQKRKRLESVKLRRHCNSKATPISRQSISIFWVFLFENIPFWEVPPGNHKRRSRGATPLLDVK